MLEAGMLVDKLIFDAAQVVAGLGLFEADPAAEKLLAEVFAANVRPRTSRRLIKAVL